MAFKDHNRTRRTEDNQILDAYSKPPFTKSPGPEQAWCHRFRRFYYEVGRNQFCWVTDRGVLRQGASPRRLLLKQGIPETEHAEILAHLKAHHQIEVTPYRMGDVIFSVAHNQRDLPKRIAKVYAGQNLSHLVPHETANPGH